MRVEIRSVGVDVSKDRVEISEGGAVARMANKRQELAKYFSGPGAGSGGVDESLSRGGGRGGDGLRA